MNARIFYASHSTRVSMVELVPCWKIRLFLEEGTCCFFVPGHARYLFQRHSTRGHEEQRDGLQYKWRSLETNGYREEMVVKVE